MITTVDHLTHSSRDVLVGTGSQQTNLRIDTPIYLAGNFAWLHRPKLQNDTAVVICSGLGWDGLHAYHPLRLLADQLAGDGYWTLRLHYSGTGNSGDPESDAAGNIDLWSAWEGSVHQACDWLRTHTNARRIVLIGVRVGALLACEVAAQRSDVAALLLLAPVLRGKSYMRQIDMEARLETGTSPAADGGLDFHELRFSPTVVRHIEALDVRDMQFSTVRSVGVFAQADSKVLDNCISNWTEQGIDVRKASFAGLESLLLDQVHSDWPAPELDPLLQWFEVAVEPISTSVSAILPPASAIELPQRLSLSHSTERPITFGEAGRLFGILSHPVAGAEDTPLVLILNTGRDPHYGVARLGTQLARCLAEIGVASFRFDFTGLGDSRPPAHETDELSATFGRNRNGDVEAALDTMEALGYRRFAVQGLCAGAYHAYWAAIADQRIATILLINMPLFAWTSGDTVPKAVWRTAPAAQILQRAYNPDTWKRILAGERKAQAILGVLGRRCYNVVRNSLNHAFGVRQAPPQQVEYAHQLAKRGVRSLYLYGPVDPGLGALAVDFGPGGRDLSALPGVDLRVVTGIDHVLSGRHMRDIALREICYFLK